MTRYFPRRVHPYLKMYRLDGTLRKSEPLESGFDGISVLLGSFLDFWDKITADLLIKMSTLALNLG
jgi:hypothetical protein